MAICTCYVKYRYVVEILSRLVVKTGGRMGAEFRRNILIFPFFLLLLKIFTSKGWIWEQRRRYLN